MAYSPSPSQVPRSNPECSDDKQVGDRTVGMFCPPVPTPLAESALNWTIDDDRRLVQKSPWPDTPAPWDSPVESRRTPTGIADPLLPPADSGPCSPLLSSPGTPSLRHDDIFPHTQFSDCTLSSWITAESSKTQSATPLHKKSATGLQLVRSLTHAFRKRSESLDSSLQTASKIPAMKPPTPLPLTPDPPKLDFPDATNSTLPQVAFDPPDKLDGNELDVHLDDAHNPTEKCQRQFSRSRCVIGFLQQGRAWIREVNRPENLR